MTTGQQLEVVRVLLGGVYRDLRTLVAQMGTAPLPSVQSATYDKYVDKLDSIEQRLKQMKTNVKHLRDQGPGFPDRSDPYKAKQRSHSLQHHVSSVNELLAACFDLLAQLLSPDKALMVRTSLQLDEKLLKFSKMLDEVVGMPTNPGISATIPKGEMGSGMGAVVALMLIAVAAIKKKRFR
jgi:hypothetical protein